MVRFNDIYIVGIDHGYGNLKTASIAIPSGVKVYDIEPPITSGLLVILSISLDTIHKQNFG